MDRAPSIAQRNRARSRQCTKAQEWEALRPASASARAPPRAPRGRGTTTASTRQGGTGAQLGAADLLLDQGAQAISRSSRISRVHLRSEHQLFLGELAPGSSSANTSFLHSCIRLRITWSSARCSDRTFSPQDCTQRFSPEFACSREDFSLSLLREPVSSQGSQAPEFLAPSTIDRSRQAFSSSNLDNTAKLWRFDSFGGVTFPP